MGLPKASVFQRAVEIVPPAPESGSVTCVIAKRLSSGAKEKAIDLPVTTIGVPVLTVLA